MTSDIHPLGLGELTEYVEALEQYLDDPASVAPDQLDEQRNLEPGCDVDSVRALLVRLVATVEQAERVLSELGSEVRRLAGLSAPRP